MDSIIQRYHFHLDLLIENVPCDDFDFLGNEPLVGFIKLQNEF